MPYDYPEDVDIRSFEKNNSQMRSVISYKYISEFCLENLF